MGSYIQLLEQEIIETQQSSSAKYPFNSGSKEEKQSEGSESINSERKLEKKILNMNLFEKLLRNDKKLSDKTNRLDLT